MKKKLIPLICAFTLSSQISFADNLELKISNVYPELIKLNYIKIPKGFKYKETKLKKDLIEKILKKSPNPKQESDYYYAIEYLSQTYGIEKHSNLIKAIVSAESSYRRNITSEKGAKGLMQLKPSTAADLGIYGDFWLFNIDGGIRYFMHLVDIKANIKLAIAAYNCGPNHKDWKNKNQLPPFSTTKEYVKTVLKRWFKYEQIPKNRKKLALNKN